jgi:VIT1/CCC1 family predicted Fe2+/Mn2+ transporter
MKFAQAAAIRSRVLDVNDGIVATAGVIEGFLAAGAGADALLTASIAVTIAGAASVAGIKYSEAAAHRDAERVVVEEELAELRSNPEDEIRDLAAHYEQRGVSPTVALEVATQISAHDALAAQLASEHGIHEQTSPIAPLWSGLTGALAYSLGAALPIMIVVVAPAHLRAIATVIAVLMSLTLTAIATAQVSRARMGRAVLRALAVGVIALGLAVVAGSFLPDPDGASGGTEQEYFPELP